MGGKVDSQRGEAKIPVSVGGGTSVRVCRWGNFVGRNHEMRKAEKSAGE